MLRGPRSLLKRFLPDPGPAAAPAQAPEGLALYVVGDVHGRSDLLRELLRRIARDAAGRPEPRRELVFLGDYVDRGPDSRGVLELILAARAESDVWSVTTLAGNHERTLLRFLEDPEVWASWSEFGARETLQSYGVQPPPRGAPAEDWARASRALGAALPAPHRRLLEGLELSAERGDYLCVHAGVRPGVPLDRQSEEDLLWIREDFLRSERRLDKVVVHGHTPSDAPYVGEHRIGLDTGAYATGVLTAIRLAGAERTLIQARPSPASWS